MKLRTYFLLLMVSTLAPIVLFGAGAARVLSHNEHRAVEQQAVSRMRLVSAAVDAELRSSINVLASLGTSPVLRRRAFRDFEPEAERVLATQPHWVNLLVHDADGQIVFNLRNPRSAAVRDRESVLAVIRSRLPTVGATGFSELLGRTAFVVRVPVSGDPAGSLVLSAIVDPELIGALIRSIALPDRWVAAVIDPNRRFVARSVPAPGAAGNLVSPGLRAALDAFDTSDSEEGSAIATTLEGTPSTQYFVRSRHGRWVTAVAVPNEAFTASAWTLVGLLGAGLLLALLAAWALAALLSRRFVAPLTALAEVAPSLAKGHWVDPPARLPVDEIARLSRALTDAAKDIRRRDESVVQFIAMLSHELRNPLATISNAAQILKISSDAAVTEQARQAIERQARHMRAMIDDLLEVGRIHRGEFALKKAQVDPGEICLRAIDAMRVSGRIEERQVEVTRESGVLWADPTRVEQILVNLLDNAIKHTGRSGTISIDIRNAPDAVVMTLDDDGEGIRGDLLPHVFDLFVQGDGGIARTRGGLGVGLWLVKRLVDLHGGSVTAASDGPGRGARFEVRLPRKSATPLVPDRVDRTDCRAAGDCSQPPGPA
jgi:signal transduction histidine kinase